MKRLMLAAAIVIATAGMSFAQSSANTNVTVNAAVIQGLTISATGTLDFGNIVAGTTPAALDAQTNGSAPMITVTGNGATPISVTFSTASLSGPGTALTFTPSVYGDASSSNQATSSQVLNSGSVTLSGTSGSAGNYYFWLGGSLSAIPAAQTPGSYSGSWTITVNY